MGHGTPMPELRGPAARRALVEKDREFVQLCEDFDEYRRGARVLAANLAAEKADALKDASAVPCLMDMIAALQRENSETHASLDQAVRSLAVYREEE